MSEHKDLSSSSGEPILSSSSPSSGEAAGHDASAPSHPSSPPSSPHHGSSPSLEPCVLTLEDLTNSYGLTIGDRCPCKRAVYSHPKTASVSSPSPSLPLSSGSTKTLLSPFLKLTDSLPVWNKTPGVTCYDFLQRVHHTLVRSGILEAEWYKVFAFVITPEDTDSMNWVIANLCSTPMSWKDACTSFTSHFELADSEITLQRQFDTCIQSSKETAQVYSDRFRVLCTRLQVQLDDKRPSTSLLKVSIVVPTMTTTFCIYKVQAQP